MESDRDLEWNPISIQSWGAKNKNKKSKKEWIFKPEIQLLSLYLKNIVQYFIAHSFGISMSQLVHTFWRILEIYQAPEKTH